MKTANNIDELAGCSTALEPEQLIQVLGGSQGSIIEETGGFIVEEGAGLSIVEEDATGI